MKAADLEAGWRARLADAREALDSFRSLPAGADAGAVLIQFDRLQLPIDEAYGRASLYARVHPDEDVRSSSRAVVQDMAAFGTELSLDQGVFARLAALDADALAEPDSRRRLARALRDFRRAGVDRDEPTRQRLEEIDAELVAASQEFEENLSSDTRSIRIEDGAAGLAGLPADFVAAHPEDEHGVVTVTTDSPDFQPFMKYAERGDLRRALHYEFSNRGAPENLDVLGRILALRREKATLLGCASWADYATADKMVGSARAASEFIERIHALARPRLEAEVAELLGAKRLAKDPQRSANGTHAEDAVLHDWERAFWTERVSSERFSFDGQAARPYFPYASVKDGVLATIEDLYGIEFRRNDDVERWHPSVEVFDVWGEGRHRARLWLDMHPRPDKYKHAAMFPLRSGVLGEALPEAALVCNFPEPRDGDPALLEHTQVTTIFHEFGHLLHHLFAGRQRYLEFSGTATEWDFVEVPSQLFEEWAWNTDVLAHFALHADTGAPIPADLVVRMREAEEYGKGIQVGRQMFFARLSLEYHESRADDFDPMRHMVALKHSMLPFPHEEGTHFPCNFGHLVGYSALYYTYMWSLVIAKDLWSAFESDPLDREVAGRYRAALLDAGGSRDARDLVQTFLGREYDPGAFERWLAR